VYALKIKFFAKSLCYLQILFLLCRKFNIMKNMPKNIFFIILISGIGHLFAQDANRQQQMDSIVDKYQQAAHRYSALYNGNQQIVPPLLSNHPYLNDIQFATARLSYHGVIYPEVLLRFDLSQSKLIVKSPNNIAIVLYPEYVDFAELHGKHIIYFHYDSLSGSPSSGYYNLLHSGKCRILERNTASVELRSLYQQYYIFKKRFYLYHDSAYYIIRNKRSLLAVLQPYKKELKQYISSHRLRFQNNAEIFLVKTVGEYEKLSESL